MCNRVKRHEHEITRTSQTSTYETDQNVRNMKQDKWAVAGVQCSPRMMERTCLSRSGQLNMPWSSPILLDLPWSPPYKLTRPGVPWPIKPSSDLPRRHQSCPTCQLDAPLAHATARSAFAVVASSMTRPAWTSDLSLGGWRTGDRTINLLLKHWWGLITYCLPKLWTHNIIDSTTVTYTVHSAAPLSI